MVWTAVSLHSSVDFRQALPPLSTGSGLAVESGWWLIGFVRLWSWMRLSVREPPDADRQPALLPVGLSATILPYLFVVSSSYCSGKGKVRSRI